MRAVLLRPPTAADLGVDRDGSGIVFGPEEVLAVQD
jgi:hypothetical protein